MEQTLVLLGMLFFMFLVLSAAVETILEVFRGIMEHFGFTWTSKKISLEEALTLSKEFGGDENAQLHTRIEVLKNVAQQMESENTERLQRLNDLSETVTQTVNEVSESVSDDSEIKQRMQSVSHKVNGELGNIALQVREGLNKHNRRRIFITRFAAAVVGCLLTWQSEFYVFHILASASMGSEGVTLFSGLDNLQSPMINILIGGLAASAGSAYWHDQLSKIRNLKSVTKQLKVM